MDAIRATWKNGQVVLDGPVDWPDGSRAADLAAWEQKVKGYTIANMDKGLEDAFP
jgi:hypothetical protein